MFKVNSDNISRFVNDSSSVSIVMFGAEWCPHSKKFSEEWKEAGKTLKGEHLRMGRADLQISPDLYKRYSIKSVPTVLGFVGEKRIEYSGSRNSESIVTFARKLVKEYRQEKMNNPVRRIRYSELDSLIGNGGWMLMVEMAGCKYCKEIAPQWKTAASLSIKHTLPVSFAVIDGALDSAVMDKYRIQGVPTILGLKNGNLVGVYSGDRTAKDILRFSQRVFTPTV
jgi:thioredoxin-like negative regulator of GroEL